MIQYLKTAKTRFESATVEK